MVRVWKTWQENNPKESWKSCSPVSTVFWQYYWARHRYHLLIVSCVPVRNANSNFAFEIESFYLKIRHLSGNSVRANCSVAIKKRVNFDGNSPSIGYCWPAMDGRKAPQGRNSSFFINGTTAQRLSQQNECDGSFYNVRSTSILSRPQQALHHFHEIKK